MKQIIVMRTDLNMPLGKYVAQGAHASMKAVVLNISDERVIEWLKGPFTKIAVGVGSEEELNSIHQAAKDAGLISEEIIDAGRTVFNGMPTLTCIAVGPDTSEKLDPITGHLELLK